VGLFFLELLNHNVAHESGAFGQFNGQGLCHIGPGKGEIEKPVQQGKQLFLPLQGRRHAEFVEHHGPTGKDRVRRWRVVVLTGFCQQPATLKGDL